ncbi:dihydropteroate synthase [Phycisphaerales bacterium AB-hyl4]|uniref:dihydropteroate synthase n=1 Tax=Natronomicrosphaera hydrolytica TaxID=3242702 RepID=A0ABV4TZH8_9BACT
MKLTAPQRVPLDLTHPRVMGILNVTPDSFSDGKAYDGVEAAVSHGIAMADEGAMVIDVGGESTRPGAKRVSAAEQRKRVVDVIRRLRIDLNEYHPDVWISVDTTLTAVAEPALRAGASLINDISAGREDPAMFDLAAAQSVPIVLMHMQGTPETMQRNPRYNDVVAEVQAFLLERADDAAAAGLTREQIVIDPGVGFGKTVDHNLRLLASLADFVATGHPVMLGASRKGFIGKVAESTTQQAKDRVGGTCATTTLGVWAGVSLFRVHDVRPNLQAAQVTAAIRLAQQNTGAAS